MATAQDLIGLGMPWPLANVLQQTPILTSAVGATAGSAYQMGPSPMEVVVSGTSAVALPQVGGQSGITLGVPYAVANLTSAAISVFTEPNVKGSVVTMYARGTSGVQVSVAGGTTAFFFPVTISTWTVMNASAA